MATTTEPTPPVATRAAARDGSLPRFHSGKAFFWGVVLILGVGFLAWLLVGYFGTDSFENLDQKRVKEREAILDKRKTEDGHYLNDPPSYFDKGKGKIRVPIDEAMQMVLPVLAANKPHAAYPLSQSPPQPAAAPSSPDKGAGSPKDGNINPPSSNPTVGQPSPAAAQSPTPAPRGEAAPPPPANAPGASATPQVGEAATHTPAPTPAPAATNNALNPGDSARGAHPQPSPSPRGNTETDSGNPTPSGAQPQPMTSPAAQASPSTTTSQDTPSPKSDAPGATPGATPG